MGAKFGGDDPSKLPPAFITAGGGGTVTLHAMHGVVDWFAFAVGALQTREIPLERPETSPAHRRDRLGAVNGQRGTG